MTVKNRSFLAYNVVTTNNNTRVNFVNENISLVNDIRKLNTYNIFSQ